MKIELLTMYVYNPPGGTYEKARKNLVRNADSVLKKAKEELIMTDRFILFTLPDSETLIIRISDIFCVQSSSGNTDQSILTDRQGKRWVVREDVVSIQNELMYEEK